MADNQLGKTLAGGFECAMHLTGRYPAWWAGRRFDRAVRFWVASVTSESTRDNAQRILIGLPALREEWGTGTIPGHAIEHISLGRSVADAIDSVVVRHSSGGVSMLNFKAYGMGREKWQKEPHSVVWAARADGVLLGMTYRREQEVVGWHQHVLGGQADAAGASTAVEAIAVIPAPDGSRDE
ncbi:MAG: terminase large subunit domain-containing protein, partial [Methyloligellaceae bacterium]